MADEKKDLPKKKDKEAEERKRRNDKRKKLKEKKKAVKEKEEAEWLEKVKKEGGKPATAKGKGGKGKGQWKAAPKAAAKDTAIDDDIEVDYVVPDVLEGTPMEEDPAFAAVRERFKHIEPAPKEDSDEEDEDRPKEETKKRSKPKASLMDEADDSDEEDEEVKTSKKKRKLSGRLSVAELKTLVKRPDVVEVWDTTSADPKLLVYLKAYRNTVLVPRHWSSKRKYMAGKRGVEKPPFKLPEFIEATGIAKIRQAIMEKQAEQSLKQKGRDKVHPKMGKLDIDYQVLHDAFFKFASKPSSSTVPSLPTAVALTSRKALETSWSARSEIDKTSLKPENLPTPASTCGCVATNSNLLLPAIFKPSSDEELVLPVISPRCKEEIRSTKVSTWLFFCTASVYSCVSVKFSRSFSSRCASSCNLPRLLEDLKWLMSLSCVSTARLIVPCVSSTSSSKFAALSVSAVSCCSQTVSSRPKRNSSA